MVVDGIKLDDSHMIKKENDIVDFVGCFRVEIENFYLRPIFKIGEEEVFCRNILEI